MILGGAVLAERGHGQEGIEQIRRGLSAFRATGAALHRPYQLALLAATLGREGQAEEGLYLVAEALTQVHEAGERNFEAELYRLKGELTLQQWKVERPKAKEESEKWKGAKQKAKGKGQKQGARDWRLGASSASLQAPSLKPQVPRGVAQEVEGYFLKAIEIAQHQQAKSWEL